MMFLPLAGCDLMLIESAMEKELIGKSEWREWWLEGVPAIQCGAGRVQVPGGSPPSEDGTTNGDELSW